MRLKYVGPHDAVEVLGVVVKRGESAELPEDLLSQPDNWQVAAVKKKES